MDSSMASTAIIPAGKPPAGVKSNFVGPHYEGAKFIGVSSFFLLLAVVVVVLRTYTRTVIQRCFAADDYIMILALILALILSAFTFKMLDYGLAKHMWDVPLTDLSPGFLKWDLLAAIIYCAGTAASKSSILLFYLRIFPGRTFQIAVWIAAFFVVGYNLATIFANIFSCNPIAKSWDVMIPTGACINRPLLYFANAGLGIFTDFVTLLLPFPILRRLQLPLKQKIGVVAVMMTGAFVCIISIVRLASLYQLLRSSDLTYNTSNALLWVIIELDMSIVGGSVPAIRPFVRQYFPSLLGPTSDRYSSGRRRYHKSGSQGGRSQELKDFNVRKLVPGDDGVDTNPHSYVTTVKGGSQRPSMFQSGDGGSEEFIMYNGGELPESQIVRTMEYRIEGGSERTKPEV